MGGNTYTKKVFIVHLSSHLIGCPEFLLAKSNNLVLSAHKSVLRYPLNL